MGVKKKLLTIYTLLGLLPAMIIGIYLTYTTQTMILNQRNTQIMADNKRMQNILFNITYLATTISNSICFDNGLQTLIATQYSSSEAVYDAYRNCTLINSFDGKYAEFSGLKIYVNNQSMISNQQFVVADHDIKSSDWYKQVESNTDQVIWFYDDSLDAYGSLRLARRIPLPGNNQFAVLVLSISDNFFKLMVDDTQISNIFYLNDAKAFYSDLPVNIGNSTQIQLKGGLVKKNSYWSIYQGKEILTYDSSLNAINSSNTFKIVTFDQTAKSDVNQVTLLIVCMLIVAILIQFILILEFSNNFSQRVVTLQTQMSKIAQGDLDIINTFTGSDELGKLFTSMKITIESINNLNQEIYNEKLTKEQIKNHQIEIEFKMLTNQINPHFLFNTLETIRMKATLEGQKEITEIVNKLGKLMRHTLEVQNRPVSLSSEIDYVKAYLDIQHFRFEEKITYNFNIHQSIDSENYFLLPLLMQPLIENAAIHGLADTEQNGVIEIIIFPKGDYLMIQISDNGKGMNPATLRSLKQSLQNVKHQNTVHIGLRNVYQRIKLYYGESYGLDIKSTENTGTDVTIYLPLISKEASSLESFDS